MTSEDVDVSMALCASLCVFASAHHMAGQQGQSQGCQEGMRGGRAGARAPPGGGWGHLKILAQVVPEQSNGGVHVRHLWSHNTK